MTKHSPLGASSAERWMNCEGSPTLISALRIEPEADDPEYRRQGTAAHAALAHCLSNTLDAWEIAGEKFEGEEVTPEMVAAIQVFIDIAAPLKAKARVCYIEHSMAHPDFHPDFYGTVDFSAIEGDRMPGDERVDYTWIDGVLTVLDFKYGEGITVDVAWNPQIMYYAYGIVRSHPRIKTVRMAIVQPRITWHPEGAVRWWDIDAETLIKWAEGTLYPAMVRTETATGLSPGEWCRFCPAKLVCPVLTHLFGAAATADAREIINFTDAEIGRNYPLIDAVKHYLKALSGATFRRLQQGAKIETLKLVRKKADRVFKPEAEAVLKLRVGDDIYTAPELKSPAQIEKLGALAKELVGEYAYTPEAGLTVALADDSRSAVPVKLASETFGAKETDDED